MNKKGFWAFILCLILILNISAIGTVHADNISYYEAHKTIEIKGKTDKIYANKFVTLVLKTENRVINIGETIIDGLGNYKYAFKLKELPQEAELFVKCADKNVTETAYEAILNTKSFVNVNYETEESSDGYRIIADMSPVLEKSESYTSIAAQYDSSGALTGCKIFNSSDMDDASLFDKTVEKSGALKFFVWTNMKEMIPSAYTSEGGGKLILKFGINADKQAREGYTSLKSENNYELFNKAKAEITDEFNVIQSSKPDIKRAYYVAQNGSDSALGDKSSPFATIERALEEYSRLSDEEKDSWTAVYLREGEYNINTDINISAGKLFIGAYNNEKVVLKNTRSVGGDKIIKVDESNTDKEIINRINPDAENMYYIDYSDLGIDKMPGFTYGTSGTKPVLTYNGKTQDISRYPNAGDTYIQEVYDSGYDDDKNYTENVEFVPVDKKPFVWKQSNEIGVSGQLCVTWYYNHMQADFDYEKGTVKTPARQTVSQGNKCAVQLVNHPEDKAHFYYYNIFEEIDMPSEWCSSDAENRIYIYLENKSASDKLEISAQTAQSLINIEQSEDVVIDSIEFNTAQRALNISGSKRVVVQNCGFENITKRCVGINLCEYCGVINSEFKNCGYGVGIGGGKDNLISLKAERNFVQNCHFNKMSQTCVSIGESCGNVISHNLGENYDASCFSIFGGCENIIEYNESSSGGFNGNEANIIYIDGQYTSRNNHVRYNYIHDNSPDPRKILLGAGIVMDDLGESNFAYGNILKNIGSTLSANGGDNNMYDSNIIIDCIKPYGATDGMYGNEKKFGEMISDIRTGVRFGKYFDYSLDGTNWSARYPNAVDRMEYLSGVSRQWNTGDHTSEDMRFAMSATGNYFTNNITVNSEGIEIGPNITDYYSYENPEISVPQYEGNDYNVVYNNTERDTINLNDIEYFSRIGMQSVPQYENKSSGLEIIYPKQSGALVSGNVIEAVWKRADNATSYRIIVSDSADMNNILYEKPLTDNRVMQSVQTYPQKTSTYYYKIEAYNSRMGDEPIAQSSVNEITFDAYTQQKDEELITKEKSNLASSWLGTVGTQYIRNASDSCNVIQMSDDGQYVRFTADSQNVNHRLVYGKYPYDSVEKYNSVYDPSTTISTSLKIRFPNKDKFGDYADAPFIHMSPSVFSDMSYGGHGKAAFFRIQKSDDKYILYKGLAVKANPVTKIGEYTSNELFGRWIDVTVDINIDTKTAYMTFDNKYTAELNMDEISWGDSGYSWNKGNYLRFYDFILRGDGNNDFVMDVKDVTAARKVNK